MAMLPAHLKGRAVHFVQPNDDYDEEDDEQIDPEYDQMKVAEKPADKRKKILKEEADEEEQENAGKDVRLTKHMKEIRQLPPMHTGGTFQVLKDEKHALSMNYMKISLLDIQDFKLLASLVQENEDISTFALSPNQEYLATANK